MTYYVGNEFNYADVLGEGSPRFFYGLRRIDTTGNLHFTKLDQFSTAGTITLNTPGTASGNYEDFEYGVDFFDGRLALDHSRPYPNLYFDQYRWDNKNCYYYINEQGELVVRIGQVYEYTVDQIIS